MMVQILSGTFMLVAMYLLFSGKIGDVGKALGPIGVQFVNAITVLQGRPLK